MKNQLRKVNYSKLEWVEQEDGLISQKRVKYNGIFHKFENHNGRAIAIVESEDGFVELIDLEKCQMRFINEEPKVKYDEYGFKIIE